jgi:coenzyme F420 hydrogenase subunit beta
MKAAETVLHLRRQEPRRMKSMIPDHVRTLVAPYGLKPDAGETDEADTEKAGEKPAETPGSASAS